MIVYRVQATTSAGWVTEWHPTLADAKAARDVMEGVYPRVWIDKLDVSDGREGLAHALTHAAVHRTNWPGEEVT